MYTCVLKKVLERWHKFNKMEQIKINIYSSVLFSFIVTYNLSLKCGPSPATVQLGKYPLFLHLM